MASISNLYVKPELVRRGAWRNWDAHAATGGQITMLKDDAELLGIFIGIFLVFAAAGLWTLLAYLLFQLNRRRRRRKQGIGAFDGLYHQQQTILRNGGSDIAIGGSFLKLWLAWGNSPKVLRRTLPIVILALASFGFFLIALPFITAVEMFDNQGNQVLIKSPRCGFWAPDLENYPLAAYTGLTQRTFEAASYVDNCYESKAESALCDQFLAKRQLPIIRVYNVSCPFDESVCLPRFKGDKHPAITIKTDDLDSHKDFGINAPPGERVKMRRSMTCSPLNVNRFSKVIDGIFLGENITTVEFGPTATSNYTYGASNFQIVADSSYSLQAFYSLMAENTSYSQLFDPIPELRRNDADITVALLNNNMVPVAGVDGPCSDPFFSATKKPLPKVPGYYWPDNPITGIGCIEQYEFAKAGSDDWGKPMSLSDATQNTTFIKELSKKQVAAYAAIQWATGQAGGVEKVLDILGADALKAKKDPGWRDGAQNPLPNDQWKREVEYWFKIGLAKVQLGVVNLALGPSDPKDHGLRDNSTFVVGERQDLFEILCASQKVHSLEFKNLHRAGFISLAVLGSLSIILPSLVLRIVICWRKRKEDVLTWTSYGQLQLQRMAAEGAGVQGWKRGNEDVPLLDPHDQPSGDVDVRNLGADGLPHPVWAWSGANPSVVGGSVPRPYEEYQGHHRKDESTEVLLDVIPGLNIRQNSDHSMQGGYDKAGGWGPL